MSTPGLALNGGAPAISTPTPAWPVYDQTDADALVEVLNSGRWGSTAGDVVQTFEAEFAAHQDSKYGFALNNGTLALAAALRAGGVGIGDEVIVPPYTFIATAAAALFVGAVPVFADVDPTTCSTPRPPRPRSPSGPRRSSRCTWPAPSPTWMPSPPSGASTTC